MVSVKTAFFRSKVIHTEDSAVDDQNTITLKENKIMSLLQRTQMSQHILLDLSGLLGTSWEQSIEQIAGSRKG